MTIAIGLLCSDGIVIASDSEEVWANLTKRNVDKIHAYSFDPGMTCVIASAGDIDLLRMFAGDVQQRTWVEMRATNSADLRDIAETSIRHIFETNITPLASFPADQRPQLESIVGVVSKGKIELYTVSFPQKIVQIGERSTGSHHVAVGIGSMIADSLLDRLHSVGDMKVEPSADLAVYILKHVKSVVQDCDGYSDVILQRDNGQIESLAPNYVDDLEKWYAAYDEIISDMFRVGLSESFGEAAHNVHSYLLQMERQKPQQQRLNHAAMRPN